MTTITGSNLIVVDFMERTTAGPISVPGVKAGDIIIYATVDPLGPTTGSGGGGFWGTRLYDMVQDDDVIVQQQDAFNASEYLRHFTAVLLRPATVVS